MGLALGSSIISNNHEYGYKENVNAELALAKAYTNSCEAFSNSCSNAESNALQSMNSAKTSEDNAAQSETNSKASENNAKISESNAKAYAESINLQKTNCLTEIPQDIKIELNDGTLTLKAGSKVYIPNGFESDGVTKKFDVVTIEDDLTTTNTNVYSNDAFIRVEGKTELWADWSITDYSSGTNPSGYTGWYYNLTTNTSGYYDNGVQTSQNISLPLGIVGSDGSKITLIKQIFNGFGFIGSTVYTLPGVKGLIPNGRDNEGHPLNIETVTKKVQMLTITSEWGRSVEQFFLDMSGATMDLHRAWMAYTISNITPVFKFQYMYWYKTAENKLYATEDSGNTWNQIFGCCSCKILFDNGRINEIRIHQPFRAIDFSDKAEIGTWGMPCGRYQEITLGAPNAMYQATVNGWMLFMKEATDYNQWIYMSAYDSAMEACGIAGSSGWCRIFFPVKKGDRFLINYSAAGTNSYCRQIFAEGEI